MTHPPRFSDDDLVLERVRRLALALPGTAEKISHGRPVFHTTKVFAWYGMSRKDDGVWVQHPQSVCVLLPEEERLALAEHPLSWVPGYLGPSGWLGIDLSEDADWEEVAELLEESYRQTAPLRLVSALDRGRA